MKRYNKLKKGRNYKLQNSNNKQITMTKSQNSKQV